MSVVVADCIEAMRAMEPASVDAIVTDPPYGMNDTSPANVAECLTSWIAGEDHKASGGGFMGRVWDSWVPGPEMWREAFRVLKPGAHVVAFSSTRTSDLLAIALRLAGFEIRDTIAQIFFTGFPKSLAVDKAIDAHLGADREVVGTRNVPVDTTITAMRGGCLAQADAIANGATSYEGPITAPATPEAKQWQGFGTAIKPSHEPAILARKPLDGTVAHNVLTHGTGALNIDACRYGYGDNAWPGPGDEQSARKNCQYPVGYDSNLNGQCYGSWDGKRENSFSTLGRFPANIYHCPKPSRSERERGLDATNATPIAGHDAVDRKPDTAGLENPRAGAGRTAGVVFNNHPT